VGDRPATDGALADQLAIPFALVLSGVTREGDQASAGPPQPAITANDLRTLVARTVKGG
jgi:ribonucleotide monophosphatase NagD (HAD superfamily)